MYSVPGVRAAKRGAQGNPRPSKRSAFQKLPGRRSADHTTLPVVREVEPPGHGDGVDQLQATAADTV